MFGWQEFDMGVEDDAIHQQRFCSRAAGNRDMLSRPPVKSDQKAGGRIVHLEEDFEQLKPRPNG